MSQPLFANCHCLHSSVAWRLKPKEFIFCQNTGEQTRGETSLSEQTRGETVEQCFLEKNIFALKNIITHRKGKNFNLLFHCRSFFNRDNISEGKYFYEVILKTSFFSLVAPFFMTISEITGYHFRHT